MASRLTKPIRWLLADNTQTRQVPSIDPITAWLRDDTTGSNSVTGVRVTQDTSLSIGAVFACVSLISDTVAMLPADTFVKDGEYRRPAPNRPDWLDYPDSDGLTWMSFTQQWVVSKLISHGACIRILKDEDGEALAFKVLDPRKVNPDRTRDGRLFYDYNGERGIPASEMIYDSALIRPGQIKGVSRVDELREMFGLAKALEQFSARFFGQGSTTSGVLEFPGEGDKALAIEIKDNFEEGHKGLKNAHRPGVIFGGGKWVKTGVDPEQAQMLETRKFSVEEFARFLGVPPFLLGSQEPGAASYASTTIAKDGFSEFTVLPLVGRIEDQHHRLLAEFSPVPGGRAKFKLNMDHFLRVDLLARYQAYETGIRSGVLKPDEARDKENLGPVPGGDRIYMQAQMTPIDQLGQPAPSPVRSDEQEAQS